MELIKKEIHVQEMRCSCGARLRATGLELDADEKTDLQLALEQTNVSRQALSPQVINRLELEDGKLYEYIQAATDLLAKARFLEARCHAAIRQRHSIQGDYEVVNGEIYLHEEEGYHGDA